MTKKTILEKVHDDYLQLLLKHHSIVTDEKVTVMNIAQVLDEIEIFWLKRLEIINYELSRLTAIKQCFVLSGAIYLNTSENEHYYFKTLGDYHVLNEPLMKLEGFVRSGENNVDQGNVISFFRKTYNDVVDTLTQYPYCFYVLPLGLLVQKKDDDHHDFLKSFYWRFISSISRQKIEGPEKFCAIYSSYEDIENGLNEFVLKHLIFVDHEDIKLSLRDRILRYLDSQSDFLTITKNMTETEIFLFVTSTQIMQVIDIVYTSLATGLVPFIRFNVTFSNLALMMNVFETESKLKSVLEKTIIFYILYKTVKKEMIEQIKFDDYCRRLKRANLLDGILIEIKKRQLDVFVGPISQVQKVIGEEVSKVIFESEMMCNGNR